VKVLILGYGYTAQNLWRSYQFLAEWQATTRCRTNPEKKGPKLFRFDENGELPLEVFQGVTHVLCTIPPYQGHDLFLKKYHKDLRSISTLRWIGYLSSTGVYGNHEGKWVNEKSKCRPTSPTSKARYLAEQEWFSLSEYNLPIHIFRLSGIYGPGRSSFDRLKEPKPLKILAPNHFFSRIHVEDISQLLWRSMSYPTPGEIYNVADDLPAPTHEVMDFACELLRIPPIQGVSLEEAHLTPHMAEFYQDRRKVCNLKIKQTLKIALKYPTYREGLAQIFNSFEFLNPQQKQSD
jgi:dTDP-D-glucose 4,6-dehydratase